MSSRKKPRRLTAAEKRAILDQPEPSAESLKEMPEVDFSKGPIFRGPNALRRALECMRKHRRGRPRKAEPAGTTRAKSIRLPEAVWKEISRRAKARRTTDSVVVREVIADWLERTGS